MKRGSFGADPASVVAPLTFAFGYACGPEDEPEDSAYFHFLVRRVLTSG